MYKVRIKGISIAISAVILVLLIIGICLQVLGTNGQIDNKVDLSANKSNNEMLVSSLESVSAISENDETLTSLGVPIDRDIFSGKINFETWTNTFAVKNNLTDSMKKGALIVNTLIGGELPMRTPFLVLPRTQVFTEYGGLVQFVDIEVKRNGEAIEPFSPNLFPSNISLYSTFQHNGSDLEVTYILSGEIKEQVPLPPDPVKEGYTFVGWYYDSDFTRPYDNEPIFEDTQLYAKFEINKYKVTFDSNGGSEVSEQTVNWNTTATLSTPTREGYNFVGWFFVDGTQYTNQPIKEDTSLVAHWEAKKYTITFFVEDEIYATKVVEHGAIFVDVIESAAEFNLRVLSVSINGENINQSLDELKITNDNVKVFAEPITGFKKDINTIKQNWKKVVGVASIFGFVIIVLSLGVSVAKRRKR